MSKIISCPNCGQKNKIYKNTYSARAICAKCRTKLNVHQKTVPTPSPEKNTNSSNSSSNFSWVWLLVIGGFIWWVLAQDSNSQRITEMNHTRSNPLPSYPEVAMPHNGAVQLYSNDERIAPFKIQTSQGANYLVKLVSKYSQEPVITIFIKGGNTASTEVPLGTYEVKYASGNKWYGYKHLFGPETKYSKAESEFTFRATEHQVSGYTITLYHVPNGNLHTTTINPSQF